VAIQSALGAAWILALTRIVEDAAP